MYKLPDKKVIRAKYDFVMEKLMNDHAKKFPIADYEIMLISNTYPGLWLEHVYDAIVFAKLEPSMAYLAKGQIKIFLDNQKEDGQFPCFILDSSNPNVGKDRKVLGFSQTQECVSFASLCLEVYEITGDLGLLKESYEKCVKWDKWLRENRMTRQKRLIEMFCGYDTGHDNSGRLDGIGSKGNNLPHDASFCPNDPVLPIRATCMNGVFYGSTIALSKMARILSLEEEAIEWEDKARRIKEAIFDLLYDKEDNFFYDLDKEGNKRKYRSIAITNIFSEKLLDQETFDLIYDRYFQNEKEFWTKYPFPSMSISDPSSRQDRDGNSWGFYSQGLTALRALRWMDYYGKSKDLDHLMMAWVSALLNSKDIQFGQELHPLTGQLSKSSECYSSTMLFFIAAVRRLELVSAERKLN